MSAPLLWVNSMAGRMFLVLLSGFLLAGALGMYLDGLSRQAHLEQLHLERAAERISHFVDMAGPEYSDASIQETMHVLPGIIKLNKASDNLPPVPKLARLIALMSPSLQNVQVHNADISTCFPDLIQRAAPAERQRDWQMRPPSCWTISAQSKTDVQIHLAVQTPMTIINTPSLFNPVFLVALFAGACIVSYFLSAISTAPLKKLKTAAENMQDDGTAPTIPETGPEEVKRAARAFNHMQSRIRERIVHRSEMLAGIAHDLQTPLTRIWLRTEQLEPGIIQTKLLDDLNLTRDMVREGLDLVRDGGLDEGFETLELDSLIESIADDAAEMNEDVSLLGPSNALVRVRPLSLRRAITNLVENSLKYAGHVEIEAILKDTQAIIFVRDKGPGLLADVILPTEAGTGLGLRIAHNQSELAGASLQMTDREGGGVEAIITILDAKHI